MIDVSVVYLGIDKQMIIPVTIEESGLVVLAIKRSGILSHFPEIQLSSICVGIYGKIVTLDASICDGDRIEIYRPLRADPKVTRRLRAQKQSKA